MGNKRMNDSELKESFGMRESGNPIHFPQEMGYRCPKGHAHIEWSEFKEHIWCYVCETDFHYSKDCVLGESKFNPKNLPTQPRIIPDVKLWSDCGNYCINITVTPDPEGKVSE